tara:strand:- start:2019 stop:2348 length:330 start_codon:yes stop_codon:yes gene_type:complete
MKRQLHTFATLLLLTAPAWGDFDDGQAAYERGDYEAAFVEWLPYAEQGDAHAQHNLGVMYERAFGVPQDYLEAMKWYRLAVDQGFSDARASLNAMYFSGKGVPENSPRR